MRHSSSYSDFNILGGRGEERERWERNEIQDFCRNKTLEWETMNGILCINVEKQKLFVLRTEERQIIWVQMQVGSLVEEEWKHYFLMASLFKYKTYSSAESEAAKEMLMVWKREGVRVGVYWRGIKWMKGSVEAQLEICNNPLKADRYLWLYFFYSSSHLLGYWHRLD